MSRLRSLSIAVALACAACGGDSEPAQEPRGPGPDAPIDGAQTAAQRLTVAQYENAIHDLFDEDVVVPPAIEPDTSLDGLVSIGSSLSAISPKGVEQYEEAAFQIAAQALASPAARKKVLVCTPSGAGDLACAKEIVAALGRRAWRRPLTADETSAVAAVITAGAATLGSIDQGVELGIVRLLESPYFLYRPAVGEPDPDHAGKTRYTGYELATRLSFFLWNTIPDDALLDAAERGDLVTDAGLEAEARRMIDDPRTRRGVRNFVTEWLRLDELDTLSKDPTIFTYFSPEVGPAAREETLRGFERVVFDLDADFRDVLVTSHTFVNPKLASMYAIPAPTKDGFGEVVFPDDSPRLGLLGQIGILALYAHPTSSSATLRGKFVRTVLLCDKIPPPPVNANTGLPEATPDAPTLRDREKAHLADKVCSACHFQMDPIGLALENFDGIGRYRTQENGATIDPSGVLDSVPFANARELAMVVHDNPKVPPCFVQTLYQYATSFAIADADRGTVRALTWDFQTAGFRVKSLLLGIVMTPGFRLATPPT